jgi:hypothetical protein
VSLPYPSMVHTEAGLVVAVRHISGLDALSPPAGRGNEGW